MSYMRTRSQGLSTASSDGILHPVPTPRTRTPTSDGLSPNYSLQRPVSVIGRLMDSVSTSSTLREVGEISSQDSLHSTYVPTPKARAASKFDTAALTDKEPSLSWDNLGLRNRPPSSMVEKEAEPQKPPDRNLEDLQEQIKLMNYQIDEVAAYSQEPLSQEMFDQYLLILNKVRSTCRSLINQDDGCYELPLTNILDYATIVVDNLKVVAHSQPPTQAPRDHAPSARAATLDTDVENINLESISSIDCLVAKISEIYVHTDHQMSLVRQELQQDLAKYISAAEIRITEHVRAAIAREYSSIGARCIQNRSLVITEMKKLKAAMTEIHSSLDENHSERDEFNEKIECAFSEMELITQSFNDDVRKVEVSMKEVKGTQDRLINTCNKHSELLNQISRRNCEQMGIQKIPPSPEVEPAQHEAQVNPTLHSVPVQVPAQLSEHSQVLPNEVYPTVNVSSSLIQRSGFQQENSVLPSGRNNSSESLSSAGSVSSERTLRLVRRIKECGKLILETTSMDLDPQLTRQQVVEITTYELPSLLELKKDFLELEKKAERFNLNDSATLNHIDEVFTSMRKWERSLNIQRKRHHLHLSGEKNLLKGVELQPFTGFSDEDTVYSFLETFFRFAETSCSPKDQATLLVSSYLSDHIKKEIWSFREDIHRIKMHLISRYGDLRLVSEAKVRNLSKLKHPTASSKSQIEYFKQVSQTLLQIESLASSDLINKEEITGVIYNATYVKTIASHLPEYIIELFSQRIEREFETVLPSGKRHFEILKQIVDLRWRQFNTAENIRSLRESGTQPKPAVSANVASADPCASGNCTVQPLQSFAQAQVITFPCPFHVKFPHELGNCHRFFQGKNEDRRDMCRKSLACFSCLKTDCLKVSKSSCVTDLPSGFLCRVCQKQDKRRTPNILTCIEASHSRPGLQTVEKLLRSYIKVIDISTFQKLKPGFNLVTANHASKPENSAPPKSKSTFDRRAKVPAFDTKNGSKVKPDEVKKEPKNDCVYVFQLLNINSQDVLCFYDSGATGNLIKGDLAEKVGFKTVDPENQRISGISNMSMWTGYGIYSAQLGPDRTGQYWELVFQGIDRISGNYPRYSWKSINKEVCKQKYFPSDQILPPYIGGSDPDMLLGFRVPDLTPQLEFSMPNGLGCFRCPFKDVHGSDIAYGGSHHIISEINKKFGSVSVNQLSVMLQQTVSAYQGSPWMTLDVESCSFQPLVLPMGKLQSESIEATPLCDESLDLASATLPVCQSSYLVPECRCKTPHICEKIRYSPSQINKAKIPLSKIRSVVDLDEPLVDFRCEDCENCKKCKASPTLRSTSMKERTEQRLIEESVRISYLDQKTYIKLPFTVNPEVFLKKHFQGKSSNLSQAKATYKQQCLRSEPLKKQIRTAMNELIELNFIAPLELADHSIQDIVKNSEVQHYHLWRPVFKDSISTPTRLVCDPSSTMLNLALAKGDQGVADMFSILLRLRAVFEFWAGDIKKLYNQLCLENECIPYSLLLYEDSLDPDTPPKVYYMRRGWYGIISTGPQAGVALNKAGRDHQFSHPDGSKVLLNDVFVDDINSGKDTKEECKQQVKEVQDILGHIGMKLKYVAYSGSPPPPEASKDGKSMTILGYKWEPEKDLMYLNLPEMNFKKKSRGAKPPNEFPADDPESIHKLCMSLKTMTKQHIAAKVGEFWDPIGISEPVKASYKRSQSRINSLDWKDSIPQEERDFWTGQFEKWPEIGKISFPRSTIPRDAVFPLRGRLIACSDSSDQCGGACVYLGFKKTNGNWSCQLLTAKSKLMNMSVPRNELHSLLIATELVYATVVSLSLPLEEVLIVTDSLVSLCWVSNQRSKNKVYVQNKIITINRYIRWIQDRLGSDSKVDIAHIAGTVNPADLLTKGQPSASEIDSSSTWQKGYEWMSFQTQVMPLTRFEDVSLSRDEVSEFLDETLQTSYEFSHDENPSFFLYDTDKVQERMIGCILPPIPLESIGFKPQVQIQHLKSGKRKQVPYLIDVIGHGWYKSEIVLKFAALFAVKLFHSTHSNSLSPKIRNSMASRCPLCLLTLATDGHNSISSFEFVNSREIDVVPNPMINSLNLPSLQISTDIFTESSIVGAECCSPKQQPLSIKVDAESQLDFVTCNIPLSSPTVQQSIDVAIDKIVNNYWNITATKECLKALTTKEMNHFKIDQESQILYYKGRLSNEQTVSVHDLDMLDLRFLDSCDIRFHSPCVMPSSDIFYAYCIYVHHNTAPHGGVESTLQEILKRFHPIRARKMISSLINDCVRCKIIQKRSLEEDMKNHHEVRLTLAPGFSFIMIDLAQDFNTKVRFQGRQTMRTPALVIVCLVTGATAIHACEDWSTQSVIQALIRHTSRYGIPTSIFVDPGSQLKKLKDLRFSYSDLHHQVFSKMKCNIIVSAAKSHSSQGRVERKIGLIKDLLSKLGKESFLMSFLNWETAFAQISNHLNNLPVCRASGRSVYAPEFTVLTPNRLLLGRNNQRGLSGPMFLDASPSNIIERINQAQETFFKLLLKQMHLFVPRPKWFRSSEIKIGDIVLFFIEENQLKSRNQFWKYGIILAKSGQRLTIEYTVQSSFSKKKIERNMRDVVRIASESELEYNSHKHKDQILKK